jgi:L-fucose isomerase-like protein
LGLGQHSALIFYACALRSVTGTISLFADVERITRRQHTIGGIDDINNAGKSLAGAPCYNTLLA